jgi:hypothetical protein
MRRPQTTQALPQPAPARTPGRTGGPVKWAHHTTGSAPAGRHNRRKTGRYPPGTHRTADTSPPGNSKPRHSRPDSPDRPPFPPRTGVTVAARATLAVHQAFTHPGPGSPLRRDRPDRPLPPFRRKITATTRPPCLLATARGSFLPAELPGHGGCRPGRPAGHRMGQYAHLQQCAPLVILALILGVIRVILSSERAVPVLAIMALAR